MEIGKRHLTFFWCLLAALTGLLAIQQTQVPLRQSGKPGKALLPPPARTRHAERPVDAGFQGSPLPSYIAKCREGVTDQEILWTLEDFNSAGLDVEFAKDSPLEDWVKMRHAQNRWYLEALVRGLRLTPAQTLQARERINSVFDNTLSEMKTSSGELSDGTALDFSRRWTETLEILPWLLCELSQEQAAITWKRHFDLPAEKSPKEVWKEGSMPEYDQPPPTVHNPDTGLDISFLLWVPLDGMFRSGPGPCSFRAPLEFQHCNIFLPLLEFQKFEAPLDRFGQKSSTDERAQLLADLRILSPEQLDIYLLLFREKIAEIRTALDEAAKAGNIKARPR